MIVLDINVPDQLVYELQNIRFDKISIETLEWVCPVLLKPITF